MIVRAGVGAIMLMLLATPAVSGTWRFKTLKHAAYGNYGAIVAYESDHPDGVKLAFRCGYDEELHMYLGVYLPVYKGMDRRHRVLVKIDPEERYRFVMRKVLERGIAADRFFSGIEEEVHKLWFTSRKVIAYSTYGGGALESRLDDMLRAIRDGYGHARVHIGRKIIKISLDGSARAVDKFFHYCYLDSDAGRQG